jgi:periplasmic divalent cation tolerance protein
MSFSILYVTHENMEEAKKISDYLLNKKLIACANFIPIKAAYWWNGSIESANEIVSILKTRDEHWNLVKTETEAIHPYEVPCIMRLKAEANESYEAWIRSETKDI